MFKYVATKLYLKRNTNVKVTAIFSNNFFILMVIGKLSKFLESIFLDFLKNNVTFEFLYLILYIMRTTNLCYARNVVRIKPLFTGFGIAQII